MSVLPFGNHFWALHSKIESLTMLVVIQMYHNNKILHIADEHIIPEFRPRTVRPELHYRIRTLESEVLFTDTKSTTVLEFPREGSSMTVLVFPGIELEYRALRIDI